MSVFISCFQEEWGDQNALFTSAVFQMPLAQNNHNNLSNMQKWIIRGWHVLPPFSTYHSTTYSSKQEAVQHNSIMWIVMIHYQIGRAHV